MFHFIHLEKYFVSEFCLFEKFVSFKPRYYLSKTVYSPQWLDTEFKSLWSSLLFSSIFNELFLFHSPRKVLCLWILSIWKTCIVQAILLNIYFFLVTWLFMRKCLFLFNNTFLHYNLLGLNLLVIFFYYLNHSVSLYLKCICSFSLSFFSDKVSLSMQSS